MVSTSVSCVAVREAWICLSEGMTASENILAANEPHMAGRPATLEDENTLGSSIEESTTSKVFSEQRK
jgi:hypothetical protein